MNGSTLTPPGPPQLKAGVGIHRTEIARRARQNTTGVVKFWVAGGLCRFHRRHHHQHQRDARSRVWGNVCPLVFGAGRILLSMPQEAEQDVPGVPRAAGKINKQFWCGPPTQVAACVVYGDILARYLHTHPRRRGMLGYITSDGVTLSPQDAGIVSSAAGLCGGKTSAHLYGDK